MSGRANNTNNKTTTDLDDWDTDPDFIRDMDEEDQRWGGGKRTVGSINMNELLEDVRREHKNLREKYQHSSQMGDSFPRNEFFTNKQTHRDMSPTRANIYNEDKVSKLSTKEIKREVIRSETSSYISKSNDSMLSKTVSDSRSPQVKKSYATSSLSSTTSPRKSPIPPLAPKPNDLTSRVYANRRQTEPMKRFEQADTIITTDPPAQFKESSLNKSIFHEQKSSSSSVQGAKSPSANNLPAAFKSIQEKIDAFKRDFDDIEHRVTKKSDISKVIKKTTTNADKKDDVTYVSRSNERISSGTGQGPTPPHHFRPTSTSPLNSDEKPKASIKSLSERFESLGRETNDDFKRRMEERRKEFFDRIQEQVRETRKGLDGFDIDESDSDDLIGSQLGSSTGGMKKFVTKLNTQTSPLYGSKSNNSSKTSLSSPKPKVYTKRETTQEEIVSRFVKENDKIIHDETKRNVEHTSSCHGSSDEGEPKEAQPSSIKILDRELRTSPQQQRMESPIDEIKRKIPVVSAETKGAGLMARTLYDYQAAEDDELTFECDDLITNIEKVDQGWYKGTLSKNGSKCVGLFPANYVKLLNDASDY